MVPTSTCEGLPRPCAKTSKKTYLPVCTKHTGTHMFLVASCYKNTLNFQLSRTLKTNPSKIWYNLSTSQLRLFSGKKQEVCVTAKHWIWYPKNVPACDIHANKRNPKRAELSISLKIRARNHGTRRNPGFNNRWGIICDWEGGHRHEAPHRANPGCHQPEWYLGHMTSFLWASVSSSVKRGNGSSWGLNMRRK